MCEQRRPKRRRSIANCRCFIILSPQILALQAEIQYRGPINLELIWANASAGRMAPCARRFSHGPPMARGVPARYRRCAPRAPRVGDRVRAARPQWAFGARIGKNSFIRISGQTGVDCLPIRNPYCCLVDTGDLVLRSCYTT